MIIIETFFILHLVKFDFDWNCDVDDETENEDRKKSVVDFGDV
jgi:hypothetical protein